MLDDIEPRGGRIQLVLDRRHLRHQVVGGVTLGLALADLLAGAVALRLQLLGTGLNGLALGLQRSEGRFVEKGLRVFAGGQARQHGAQIFAEQDGIKHAPIVGGAHGANRWRAVPKDLNENRRQRLSIKRKQLSKTK